MFIKGQPEEIKGKPFISEGNADFYLGRVIIELWQGEEPDVVVGEPALPGLLTNRVQII